MCQSRRASRGHRSVRSLGPLERPRAASTVAPTQVADGVLLPLPAMRPNASRARLREQTKPRISTIAAASVVLPQRFSGEACGLCLGDGRPRGRLRSDCLRCATLALRPRPDFAPAPRIARDFVRGAPRRRHVAESVARSPDAAPIGARATGCRARRGGTASWRPHRGRDGAAEAAPSPRRNRPPSAPPVSSDSASATASPPAMRNMASPASPVRTMGTPGKYIRV